MNECELRLLWLQGTPGLGASTLRRVVSLYSGPPPEAIVGRPAGWYEREWEVSARLADRISRQMAAYPSALRAASDLPIRVCTPFEAGYPVRLRRLPAPPPVVTLAGVDPGAARRSFTVAASRGAEGESGPALKAAWEAGLAAGLVPVAGHNRAVYQWGLLAAKRAAAPSVMVLDRGILAAFDDDLRRDPVPAARIWGFGYDTEQSLALSPFRLRDGFVGRNNVLRDELVFALADVVLAVSVREGGHMERLCAEAVARGQAVLAASGACPVLAGLGVREVTEGDLAQAARSEPASTG